MGRWRGATVPLHEISVPGHHLEIFPSSRNREGSGDCAGSCRSKSTIRELTPQFVGRGGWSSIAKGGLGRGSWGGCTKHPYSEKFGQMDVVRMWRRGQAKGRWE